MITRWSSEAKGGWSVGAALTLTVALAALWPGPAGAQSIIGPASAASAPQPPRGGQAEGAPSRDASDRALLEELIYGEDVAAPEVEAPVAAAEPAPRVLAPAARAPQARVETRRASPAPAGAPLVRVADSRNVISAAAMVGGSIVVESDRPFVEVSIANPEIADVAALSPRAIYVLGKKVGRTNLTMINADGGVDAVVNLDVEPDLAELKRRLGDLLPREPVEVRSAAGGIVLSGVISSSAKVGQAMALAERYAPGDVTNMMAVAEAQQVMLQVKFAEVRRSAAKQLGINLTAFDLAGDTVFTVLSGAGIDPLAFGQALVEQSFGALTIGAALDALEEKGQLRTLAEPNLVALSGDTASFLAGGEFPIPVASSDENDSGFDITVVFKTFGVSLGFTPTVIEDGLINLELVTEVSAIDPTLAVSSGDIEVPGLVVRRANTTVELEEGQSFSIAGLLQEDFRNNAAQLPWIGDVPILGALFRSTDFERQQTELVIIVTPRLVTPVDGDRLTTPADRISIPDEARLFLFGSVEGEVAPDVTPGAGFDSAYGYFLE